MNKKPSSAAALPPACAGTRTRASSPIRAKVLIKQRQAATIQARHFAVLRGTKDGRMPLDQTIAPFLVRYAALKRGLAVIGCTLALAAHAAPETFIIDTPHTSANFYITHLGINTIPGRFDKTTGKIVLDREAKAGSIEAELDVNTINTGYARRDTLLKSEDYFNVEKFPTITFRATNLRFKGDQLAAADGELTMMGVTKPVVLQLESFKCITNPANKREICGAVASTAIKRADFGMTRASRSLGEEVRISINLEAIKN